jgi:branched-subunit amino acid transport protein
MSLAIIVGAGLVAFISAYMMLKLGDRASFEGFNQHYGLQIILFALIVLSLFMIGKAVLDSGNNCNLVLTNESTYFRYGNNFTNSSGESTYHWDYTDSPVFVPQDANDPGAVFLFHEYTDYTYTTICDNTPEHNTARTFYIIIAWFMRLMGLYFGGFVIYSIAVLLKQWYKSVKFR